jgi:hypothetical protein
MAGRDGDIDIIKSQLGAFCRALSDITVNIASALKSQPDASTEESLSKISDMILVSEFGEAIATVDALLAEASEV